MNERSINQKKNYKEGHILIKTTEKMDGLMSEVYGKNHQYLSIFYYYYHFDYIK